MDQEDLKEAAKEAEELVKRREEARKVDPKDLQEPMTI
jgi:hypothetical protein